MNLTVLTKLTAEFLYLLQNYKSNLFLQQQTFGSVMVRKVQVLLTLLFLVIFQQCASSLVLVLWMLVHMHCYKTL